MKAHTLDGHFRLGFVLAILSLTIILNGMSLVFLVKAEKGFSNFA